ncbi:MAG: hypothetical protein EAZ53_12590 [Bacteroidetes bacterium]|nr:MAG: hypothetical protein EAZ53_12590 [Bacteroidota bacterium]
MKYTKYILIFCLLNLLITNCAEEKAVCNNPKKQKLSFVIEEILGKDMIYETQSTRQYTTLQFRLTNDYDSVWWQIGNHEEVLKGKKVRLGDFPINTTVKVTAWGQKTLQMCDGTQMVVKDTTEKSFDVYDYLAVPMMGTFVGICTPDAKKQDTLILEKKWCSGICNPPSYELYYSFSFIPSCKTNLDFDGNLGGDNAYFYTMYYACKSLEGVFNLNSKTSNFVFKFTILNNDLTPNHKYTNYTFTGIKLN